MWSMYGTDHPQPSSTKMKKQYSHTSTPPQCLNGSYGHTFTFTFNPCSGETVPFPLHCMQTDQGVILRFSQSLVSLNANKRSFYFCQQMHCLLKHKMLQFVLKISLYMAPTCFGPSWTIIREHTMEPC